MGSTVKLANDLYLETSSIVHKQGSQITPLDTYLDTIVENLDTITKNLDTIVESGSNANGSWTKWSDGTMIIDKIISGTADITTAWGNLYISRDINLGSFPVSFIETPTVVVSPQTQTGTQYMLVGNGGYGYATNVNAGSVALVRPKSRTSVAYRLEVIAKGKWK